MSLHKSMDIHGIHAPNPDRVEIPRQSENWRFSYPNTADFNFNYWKLLHDAQSTAIARANNPDIRIAIVGAGVAGLIAARELFRCGFTNIDIYEASDRIGGRNYSIPAPHNQYTTFEMGAMRMPFFWPSSTTGGSGGPGSKNCVLDYYCTHFGITTQNFPDPGSPVVASTGIYMNGGLGPPGATTSRPEMMIWKNPTGQGLPPNPALERVYKCWTNFANMLTQEACQVYGTPEWEHFWQALVGKYWTMSFAELVYLPPITSYDSQNNPGYFGGLGMTESQAWDFYVIGAGDGGWGAFFEISALYPIRTLLFGYGTHHQLVQGLFRDGHFAPGPYHRQHVRDSRGKEFAGPNYLGLQTLAECLFYEPVSPQGVSLYEAIHQNEGINLYILNPAEKIVKDPGGRITIHSPAFQDTYDEVIVTPTSWALEMSTAFEGFDERQLPYEVKLSMKESHYITSCKVFYPLTRRYWEVENPNHGENFVPIPQVINTDTFLQDVYGYAATPTGSATDPGVLLVSYCWEDDASKLEAASDNAALAKKCLDELDSILLNCQNVQMKISPYVDTSSPTVIHWERQPTYRACAKLYRGRSWNLDYALLTYNQQCSASSRLYFAGESYSVEGGWTEPALRMGLDAVVNLVNNTGGTFLNGFSYADYPQYNTWTPSSE